MIDFSDLRGWHTARRVPLRTSNISQNKHVLCRENRGLSKSGRKFLLLILEHHISTEETLYFRQLLPFRVIMLFFCFVQQILGSFFCGRRREWIGQNKKISLLSPFCLFSFRPFYTENKLLNDLLVLIYVLIFIAQYISIESGSNWLFGMYSYVVVSAVTLFMYHSQKIGKSWNI